MPTVLIRPFCRWQGRLAQRDVAPLRANIPTKVKHRRFSTFSAILILLAAWSFHSFGNVPTAAIGLQSRAADPAVLNHSTFRDQTWSIALEAELRYKMWRRRHLVKILGQVKHTNLNRRSIRSMERLMHDGSVLGDAAVTLQPEQPPPEFSELLELETRIRRLRHLRQVALAKAATSRSERRLAWLRFPFWRRAAIRSLQTAGFLVALDRAKSAAAKVSQQRRPFRRKFFGDSKRSFPSPSSAVRAPAGSVVEETWDVFTRATSRNIGEYLSVQLMRWLIKPSTQKVQMVDVSLQDVAGIGPAKAEAMEIIECLKTPARYVGLGARCPKGLLLTGPPGCGKTLLARAIAASASVPFISRSGADFNRIYAGQGTVMVKELFKSARSVAPAVILIDEIDYIGRRRHEERGGGLETDRSAALTQLLAEMDGFTQAEGVLVIATTNRPDILDRALLRPGRFDRKVSVPLPDLGGRLQILQTHAFRLPLVSGVQSVARQEVVENRFPPVDWRFWARRTPGFSGADLAGLVNEAAMAAARANSDFVSDLHVQAAYTKTILGVPSGRRRSKEEMALTAEHEAGHAVVNEAVRASLSSAGNWSFPTVAHISIVPAGGAGGVTQFAVPDEGNKMPQTRQALLANLAVSMGGRAAEEQRYGRGETTMGPTSDLHKATRLAREMVMTGGMSEVVGPLSVRGSRVSESLLRKVDAEVSRLTSRALDIAKEALQANSNLHQAVSQALLEHETVDGDAFQKLVKLYKVIPATIDF